MKYTKYDGTFDLKFLTDGEFVCSAGKDTHAVEIISKGGKVLLTVLDGQWVVRNESGGLEVSMVDPLKGDRDSVREMILAMYREGDVIVVAEPKGPRAIPLDGFLAQPVDGMLYDLNRLETVCLTFMDSIKWVNDYACAKVIRALAARIDELESASGKSATVATRPKMRRLTNSTK